MHLHLLTDFHYHVGFGWSFTWSAFGCSARKIPQIPTVFAAIQLDLFPLHFDLSDKFADSCLTQLNPGGLYHWFRWMYSVPVLHRKNLEYCWLLYNVFNISLWNILIKRLYFDRNRVLVFVLYKLEAKRVENMLQEG